MTKTKKYRMLINGEMLPSSDGNYFDSTNPSNKKVWAAIPEATAADVEHAVQSAHLAFSEGPWSTMSPTERGHCLRHLADLLAEKSEHLGEIESKDSGKLYKETRWQAKYVSEFFYFYAGCADKLSGETLPIDKPDLLVLTQREPLGVVVGIVPWNSQLFLSAVKIGPALAAGNTIVLKASEHASACMLEFAEIIAQSRIPKGVINIISGHATPCGKALTSHPLVRRVAFTGGAASAKHIIQNSTANFAQVSLELGGKSPILVFDDADIESAVNGSLGGIFGASGQTCVAGSRLYLQDSIADQFIEKLLEGVKQITVGDPMNEQTDMGPICTTEQMENMKKIVASSQKQGAKLLCGGQPSPSLEGQFFEPTILECLKQEIDVVDTELFGPVLAVLRFKDEQEAIRLANDSKHGLAAGIFTKSSQRSIRVAKKIQAGIVWVNTYRAISPIAAFGGMKASGYGRESGFQAMYDYTRPKTIWFNTSDEPLENQFINR